MIKKILGKLNLNESATFDKNMVADLKEAMKSLTTTNAAYSFNITTKKGFVTVKRVLPVKFNDRAAYFRTVSKTAIKKALKDNNNVKTKAANSLGMSLRTFRRKLGEYALA